MISKKSKPDIKLAIQSGGYLEFEKTGIILRFLVFHSRELRRTWRFKQTKDTQNGVLKINGQMAFYYYFDGLDCKMQTLTDGVVIDEWEVAGIKMEMRD